MRWAKRVLKGRVPKQSDRLGPWCLLEDWGGIWSAVAYGPRGAMETLHTQVGYPTAVKRVCRVCDGIEETECKCEKGDFEND
jgi:hypothetical protein